MRILLQCQQQTIITLLQISYKRGTDGLIIYLNGWRKFKIKLMKLKWQVPFKIIRVIPRRKIELENKKEGKRNLQGIWPKN